MRLRWFSHGPMARAPLAGGWRTEDRLLRVAWNRPGLPTQQKPNVASAVLALRLAAKDHSFHVVPFTLWPHGTSARF